MSRGTSVRHTALLGASIAVALLALGVGAQQLAAIQQVPGNPAMHQAPDQPIPYSHRTHLALGLVCETCHTNTAANAPMGYPETGTCMTCHNAIGRDLPAVMQLAEFAASGDPVPGSACTRSFPESPGTINPTLRRAWTAARVTGTWRNWMKRP